MAQLPFAAIESHRPDILFQTTVRSLEPIRKYIQRVKDWLESDACVEAIDWIEPERDWLARSDADIRPPSATVDRLLEDHHVRKRRQREGERRKGTVIQLADKGRDTEKAVKAFTKEGEKYVYEDPGQLEINEGERRPERFGIETRIEICEQDAQNAQLRLSRRPRTRRLLLRPNTWPEQCQLEALRSLQDGPGPHLRPFLRLFESTRKAEWPWFSPPQLDESDWQMLTDRRREGTHEQRCFVERGLGTPDFAILEGPPGSGKTTAICELILQLIRDGKRVLLCASTHVAVDNVLERLMAEDAPGRESVIPVRIGRSDKISDRVDPWRLDEVVRTERKRLQGHLATQSHLSPAQEELQAFLKRGDDRLERLVLETSNLACGTMIGILQHPDIKRSITGRREDRVKPGPVYDVMILDEASKTTFQEFLVPARFATRWIIVGDPRQLSPHVDDEGLEENLLAACPDAALRESCCDGFLLSPTNNRHGLPRVIIAADDNRPQRLRRITQVAAQGGEAVDVEEANSLALATADLIVGSRSALEAHFDRLPLDAEVFRVTSAETTSLSRTRSAAEQLGLVAKVEETTWKHELAWRISTLHALRQTREMGRPDRANALEREIEHLMPVENRSVRQKVESLRKVALPSILDLLCEGFGKPEAQRDQTAFYNGLPDHHRRSRHVLLTYQHRMAPEIAQFSFEHVYQRRALHSPDRLYTERRWGYGEPVAWRTVEEPGSRNSKAHPGEAQAVVTELEEFKAWVEANPNPQGRPWTVAVLAFYLDQERCLRKALRRWTGQKHARRHFLVGPETQPLFELDLCTVDGFQGHEADLVILSLATQRTTHFLESPNRLNVALTRARFQRVIIGHHAKLSRPDGLLGDLARAHTPITLSDSVNTASEKSKGLIR